MKTLNPLSETQKTELIQVLQARFEKYLSRHQGITWEEVANRLIKMPEKLTSLQAMESTGGEPDVIGQDTATGEIIFCDCAVETPNGRRSICYDKEALQSRKEHQPAHNAIDLAAEMGVEILTEAQYKALQELGEFDLKTSSWLQTPAAIRKLGGALFGDRRYGHVFTYHNGAQSYYAARGFRGILKV